MEVATFIKVLARIFVFIVIVPITLLTLVEVLPRLVLLAVVHAILGERISLVPLRAASKLFSGFLSTVCFERISSSVCPLTCLLTRVGFLETLTTELALALFEASVRLLIFSVVNFVVVHRLIFKTESPLVMSNFL